MKLKLEVKTSESWQGRRVPEGHFRAAAGVTHVLREWTAFVPGFLARDQGLASVHGPDAPRDSQWPWGHSAC